MASSGRLSAAFTHGLVSVIVPTYNRRELLQESLQSVLGQSYRPVEIVIIDDGSTDGTREFLDEFLLLHVSQDLQVLVLHQPNQGVSSARNAGLRAAHGEYIQYLDSDDLLDAEKIARHVACLEQNPDVEVVTGCSFEIGTNLAIRPYARLERLEGLELALTNWVIPTLNPLFRRSACGAIGWWNEEMRCFEDASYMGAIFFQDLRIEHVANAKTWVRGHVDSVDEQAAGRISFRGESEREHEHVLALYHHHCFVWREMPEVLLADEHYRDILVKESLRIARMLRENREIELSDQLIARHRSCSRSRRANLERVTLLALCGLLGDFRGARLHRFIQDLVHSFRHRWDTR